MLLNDCALDITSLIDRLVISMDTDGTRCKGGPCVWTIVRALLRRGLSAGPTIALALVYFLVSTTAVFPALDWIITSPGDSDDDFPCAAHGCGCNTTADCRNGCCCFPNGRRPASDDKDGSAPAEGMYIAATGCTGAPAELAVASSVLP